MNLDTWELDTLINESNSGEQNRYGEIEFKHEFRDRIAMIKKAVELSGKKKLSEEQVYELGSTIYWNMCQDHKPFHFLYLNYDNPGVVQGLHSALDKKMTDDSRARWIRSHLENFMEFESFSLEFFQHLKKVFLELGEVFESEKVKIEKLFEDVERKRVRT